MAVEGGYGQGELFCARHRAVGAISYQVSEGRVSLSLAAAALPASTTLGVEWENDRVRGYTIASFNTDHSGRAIQASLRMFRPGEVRGIGMILNDATDHVVASLTPCS